MSLVMVGNVIVTDVVALFCRNESKVKASRSLYET